MPLYDFRCPACGRAFEARVEPGATPACVECGGDGVQRVWSPFSTYTGPGLRGAAAARSNASRRAREEKRWDGFRAQRETMGIPPRGPRPD